MNRIDGYDDLRFPAEVLRQHGAFVAEDGTPCAVRVTGLRSAVVEAPADHLDELIEAFRFFAEHITVFLDAQGHVLRELPEVPLMRVKLADLKPSQFFVDEAKLTAVSTFVHAPEDVVVPVIRDGDGYIACDGHTRLFAAHRRGLTEALAFLCADPGDAILDFARMARERGVYTPSDLTLLPHEEYQIQWDGFCERYFADRA